MRIRAGVISKLLIVMLLAIINQYEALVAPSDEVGYRASVHLILRLIDCLADACDLYLHEETNLQIKLLQANSTGLAVGHSLATPSHSTTPGSSHFLEQLGVGGPLSAFLPAQLAERFFGLTTATTTTTSTTTDLSASTEPMERQVEVGAKEGEDCWPKALEWLRYRLTHLEEQLVNPDSKQANKLSFSLDEFNHLNIYLTDACPAQQQPKEVTPDEHSSSSSSKATLILKYLTEAIQVLAELHHELEKQDGKVDSLALSNKRKRVTGKKVMYTVNQDGDDDDGLQLDEEDERDRKALELIKKRYSYLTQIVTTYNLLFNASDLDILGARKPVNWGPLVSSNDDIKQAKKYPTEIKSLPKNSFQLERMTTITVMLRLFLQLTSCYYLIIVKFPKVCSLSTITHVEQLSSLLMSSINSPSGISKQSAADQCPILDSSGQGFSSWNGARQSANMDRVEVDSTSGQRTFSAKLVGIFSCLDSDSPGNDLTLDFRLAKPVIDLAIQTVHKRYSNIHLNVTYRTAPDICKHQRAAGHAADEFYVRGANYFVGPGCSESLASVGQLASYWNVPMCSTGYLPEMVTARFKPLTLMQLSLSVESVGQMLLELFEMNKWRHMVILTDEKHPLHSAIRDGLLEFFHTLYMSTGRSSSLKSLYSAASGTSGQQVHLLLKSNASMFAQGKGQQQQRGPQQQAQERQAYYINITARNFAYSRQRALDYEQVILDAAAYSRVMLFLARSSTVGNLLEAAHAQGMSKGQFVFIAHELFETQMVESSSSAASLEPSSSLISEQSTSVPSTLPTAFQAATPNTKTNHQLYSIDDRIDIQARSGNASDEQKREIFQPLMTISLRVPTTSEFDTFRAQVAGLSEREFNYRIVPTSLKSLYSLGVAAFMYDCVMLYADRVNYVLTETQYGRIDGKTIFEQVAGRLFKNLPGALTGDLTINRAGQRVMDFTLNDFSPKTLTLEPLAHFMAIEKRLVFLAGRKPYWAARNQSAPKSDPRCRLSELFCRLSDDPDLLDSELTGLGASIGPRSQEHFVQLGLWLLVGVILCVTLTSSLIGFIVYRRFRIESELLNLWWSIKYEDILFEEQEALCDGKRSMSSLAISNESFNAAVPSTCLQQIPLTPTSLNRPGAGEGPTLMGESGPIIASSLGLDAPSALAGGGGSMISGAYSASTLSVSGAQQTQQTSSGHSQQQQQQQSQKQQLQGGSSRKAAGKQQVAGAGSRTVAGLKAGGLHKATGNSARDCPSISSQNKNVKLKLGTILNGSRDRTQTTKVGLYKASRVAVKHLNVRSLNINRQLLIELRQVRDLTHENLIKFIGLSPDEPNIAIVSELCTRGNLQDLLQNETIRLDWPFRFSIINDIVDGLIHLHSSPIQYHGRLKSSNCVIDNRFVVKLTDFGLPTLLNGIEQQQQQQQQSSAAAGSSATGVGGAEGAGQGLADEAAVNPRLLLWTAPEHLRTKHPLQSGSQKGDIYSLAIIFQEIITRCGPFECEPILCGPTELAAVPPSLSPFERHAAPAPLIRTTDATGQSLQVANTSRQQQQRQVQRAPQVIVQPLVVQHKQRLEPEEIVNLVRMGLSPPFRPYFRPDVTTSYTGPAMGGAVQAGAGIQVASSDFNVADLIGMVQNCWQEAPALRPTIASVKQQIKKMRHGCHLGGANLMDNLLQRMERYTDNLESLVEQKTAELMEEKKRSEELLYEMLPRFVVDQLKYGHSVTPEAYEAVTISFSDIKDFTSIAAQSSPIEVVNLLNQLYTEFDDCIAQYDVYKVETIGDAYMVVSGLPVRNGDQHAKEIAEMSLALLELIRNFDVVHLPHVNLELRIGIHSGPCASGVVGTRMFRYCLFGDTVNTASRMESHGEPMKIHTSEDSANILATFKSFIIEPRGLIDIKGKGLMNTYWLTGKIPSLNEPQTNQASLKVI